MRSPIANVGVRPASRTIALASHTSQCEGFAPEHGRKHCGTSETLQHEDRFSGAAIEIGTTFLMRRVFLSLVRTTSENENFSFRPTLNVLSHSLEASFHPMASSLRQGFDVRGESRKVLPKHRRPQMDWSRVRSIAEEVELWLSLAINAWLVLKAGTLMIPRMVQRVRRAGSLMWLFDIAHPACLFLTIAIFVFCFFHPGALFFIPWVVGIGIAFSLIALVIRGLEALRRPQPIPI
jgi:hypothetical protein